MSGMSAVIHDIFNDFQNHLDKDQDVREVIRLICKNTDRLAREITTALQIIHYSEEQIAPACLKARQLLEQAQEGYKNLKAAVPATEYFKFYEHWRMMTQRYCFLISLTIWLEAGILATHETVAQVLGIDSTDEKEGFHVDLEDYLTGLLMLCSELARLIVNSSSRGEYSRALQIFKFVTEVNAGFRLLNLKNDHLRKRFDALKYDVKKIEEIVYDLSLRGLLANQAGPIAGDTQANDELQDDS